MSYNRPITSGKVDLHLLYIQSTHMGMINFAVRKISRYFLSGPKMHKSCALAYWKVTFNGHTTVNCDSIILKGMVALSPFWHSKYVYPFFLYFLSQCRALDPASHVVSFDVWQSGVLCDWPGDLELATGQSSLSSDSTRFFDSFRRTQRISFDWAMSSTLLFAALLKRFLRSRCRIHCNYGPAGGNILQAECTKA